MEFYSNTERNVVIFADLNDLNFLKFVNLNLKCTSISSVLSGLLTDKPYRENKFDITISQKAKHQRSNNKITIISSVLLGQQSKKI